MRAASLSVILGAVLAAVVLHCNTYDASLVQGEVNTVPQKNGVGWWSKTDDRGCFSAGMPTNADRPAKTSDKDVGPITLAVASMRLGSLTEEGKPDPNVWKGLGLDIDGVCTASDTCELDTPPQSCLPSASSLPRDGDNCRDNTFGKLEFYAGATPELGQAYGLSDDAFNCALCVGHYNFLIRITGYNGEPNDDRIRVDLYPSPGLEQPLPWDCSQPSWRSQLCFTPDMPWTLQEDVLVNPGSPELGASKLFDDNAYVRDGYAVTHLPNDTLFWFPGYKGLVVAYPLRIQQGVVVGKISKQPDNTWAITDGVIAGRAKQVDLIYGFRLLGLCDTTDKNYDLLNRFIRDNLDVIGDGRNDPNVPCDALSLGLTFVARQARPGRTEKVAPLVECVKPNVKGDGGTATPIEDAGADGD